MSRIAKGKLSFEQLEQKQMLAGDVIVNLVNGNLNIEGDAAANQIAVFSGAVAGSLVVQGLDGTTVHLKGSTDAAAASGLIVEGVAGHVRMAMGAGDDVVNVYSATFPKGLSIATGEGADTVRVGVPPTTAPETAVAAAADATVPTHNVNVKGSLLIRTGANDDNVRIADTGVGGEIGVSTDGGSDTVAIGAEATTPAAARKAASTSSTTTSDSDTTFTETANVHARYGINVLLGDGDDSLVIRSARTRGEIGVGGGLGADLVTLADVKTYALGIRGGDGDSSDAVKLSGVTARHAAIGLGGGADAATIADSVFGNLAVEMGAGDDKLSIAASKATRALLLGGAGSADELVKAADNVFDALIVAGFEIPEGSNVGTVPGRGFFRPIHNILNALGRRF